MTEDMRTLHLPLHRELLEGLQEAKNDEQTRSSQPLTDESYAVGILANFVFNYKFQKQAQTYEKNLQGEIRDKVIRWTDASVRALALERK